jgi:hypothetical protein
MFVSREPVPTTSTGRMAVEKIWKGFKVLKHFKKVKNVKKGCIVKVSRESYFVL